MGDELFAKVFCLKKQEQINFALNDNAVSNWIIGKLTVRVSSEINGFLMGSLAGAELFQRFHRNLSLHLREDRKTCLNVFVDFEFVSSRALLIQLQTYRLPKKAESKSSIQTHTHSLIFVNHVVVAQ